MDKITASLYKPGSLLLHSPRCCDAKCLAECRRVVLAKERILRVLRKNDNGPKECPASSGSTTLIVQNKLALKRGRTSLVTLPAETLIDVFSHLQGCIPAIRSLALTHSRFHTILRDDEYRIAQAIYLKAGGKMRILLDNTRASDEAATYRWLYNAYRRTRGLDAVLRKFEDFGAFEQQDMSLPVVARSDDIPHARRLLSTVMLAAELCGCVNGWDDKISWILSHADGEGMIHATDFADHVWTLCVFATSRAGMFIDELKIHKDGFVTRFWAARRKLRGLVDILTEVCLLQGPSALAELLGRRYKTLKKFEKAVKALYPRPHEGLTLHRLVHTQFFLRRLEIIMVEGMQDDLGVFDLDVDKWKKVVRDEGCWEELMKTLGWSKEIQLVRPRH